MLNEKIPLKNLLSQKNSCSFASVLLLLYVINGVLRSTLKEKITQSLSPESAITICTIENKLRLLNTYVKLNQFLNEEL